MKTNTGNPPISQPNTIRDCSSNPIKAGRQTAPPAERPIVRLSRLALDFESKSDALTLEGNQWEAAKWKVCATSLALAARTLIEQADSPSPDVQSAITCLESEAARLEKESTEGNAVGAGYHNDAAAMRFAIQSLNF